MSWRALTSETAVWAVFNTETPSAELVPSAEERSKRAKTGKTTVFEGSLNVVDPGRNSLCWNPWIPSPNINKRWIKKRMSGWLK